LVDEDRAGITRDEFLDAMTARNVGVGVHYLSIPEHPVYQDKFGWRPEDYPNAMCIGRQTVSLPLSAKVTDAEVTQVIQAVQATLKGSAEERGSRGKRQGATSNERGGCGQPISALST
jgi:dTDP-4-amino-4,6-dideoxygalactose transaminase